MRMELSRLLRLLAEAGTAAPPPPTPPLAAKILQGEVSWHGVGRVADADVLQAQGKMAYEAGDYNEAQQLWSQALRRRPTDVKLLSNRAAAWLAMREFQQGLEDATQAIELDPGYSKAHGRLGAALEGLGRANDALAAYSRALDLDPSSKHLQAEVARLTAHAHTPPPVPEAGAVSLSRFALAQECNRLGRPEQAIRELNKLITSKGTLCCYALPLALAVATVTATSTAASNSLLATLPC
jgi:tetratricopeptide (TPR) repeat protein